MIKRDEINTPGTCLNSAADDEPIFVLRANDELAPAVVRAWAAEYIKKHGIAGTITDARRDKYMEAINLSYLMEKWKQRTRQYRLLEQGDIIREGDEYLANDAETWMVIGPENQQVWVGSVWSRLLMRPFRRVVGPEKTEEKHHETT